MIIVEHKGNKTFPPSNEGGKVYINKILNPQLAEVGEDWKFSIKREYPLNRNDKRGRPLYMREVFLIKRIEGISLDSPTIENGRGVFKIISGKTQRLLKVLPSKVERRTEDYFSWRSHGGCVMEVVKYYFSTPQECIKVVLEETNLDPQQVFAEDIKKIRLQQEESEKKDRERKEKKDKILLSRGENSIPSFLDFWKEGVQITEIEPGERNYPLSGNEYNVFNIGKFYYYPDIEAIDEDFFSLRGMSSSAGYIAKDNPIYPLLYQALLWACCKLRIPFIKIEKRYPKKIFESRRIYHYGESGAIEENKYPYNSSSSISSLTPEEAERERIKFEEAFKSYVPEEGIAFENEAVKITFKEIVEGGLVEEVDFEEGTGMRDNSYTCSTSRYYMISCGTQYSIQYKILPHPEVGKTLDEYIKSKNTSPIRKGKYIDFYRIK